jgi:methyl-accepting chemotaxis protein
MQFFKDLSIGIKITSLVMILTLFLISTSIFGISKMNTIGNELRIVQKEDIPLIKLISGITEKQLEKAVLIERSMRIQGLSDSEHAVPALRSRMTKLADEINEAIVAAESIVTVAKTHALSSELKSELEIIERELLSVEQEHRDFESRVEQLMAQLERDKVISATEIIALERAQNALGKHLVEILHSIEDMTEHTLEKVHQDEESALWGMICSV